VTIYTLCDDDFLGTNCYVVKTEEGCIVIDPGVPLEDVQQRVGDCPIVAVLLTHAHVDHVLYLQMYKEKGIPVYLHEADNAAMGDPELNLSSDLLETMTFPEADHLIREGDRLSLAGLDIEVLHTPGHTPGSVCFRIGDDLFSGDTLFRLGYGRVDFPGGNVSDMAASLKRLKKLPGQTRVYPGHGGPTTIAREQW